MKYFICSGIFLFTLLGSCEAQNKTAEVSIKLDPILEMYSGDLAKLKPFTSGLDSGEHMYPDKLERTANPEFLAHERFFLQKYLDTLKVIDPDRLDKQDRLTYEVFKHKLSVNLEKNQDSVLFYQPVNHYIYSFPQGFSYVVRNLGLPFKSKSNYDSFIVRMQAFHQWVDDAIVTMRKGLRIGKTVPRASIEIVLKQLEPLANTPLKEHPCYQPVLAFPNEIDSMDRKSITVDYTEGMEAFVIPAYKKLFAFLKEEYIPNTRTTPGLYYNQNGTKEYDILLKFHTTTDVTAEELHQLGLSEVKRIRVVIDSVKNQIGFTGDLNAFYEFIRTNPEFYPFKTDEEILDRYRSFRDIVESNLHRDFNLIPESDFEIRATEEHRKSVIGTHYQSLDLKQGRQGVFYETIHDPKTFNYISMQGLFLHEAIPGHHFQFALEQELDLPEFRKNFRFHVYQEGWGQYAEGLGKELGLYSDPYYYLGMLRNEVKRAVRMVVDTGIHAKGWTEEEALDYMMENQPLTKEEAMNDLLWYMVDPAMGVNYKFGELKILELRDKAQAQLGANFDIREFHDVILKDGALPLFLLEKKVDSWIAEKMTTDR